MSADVRLRLADDQAAYLDARRGRKPRATYILEQWWAWEMARLREEQVQSSRQEKR